MEPGRRIGGGHLVQQLVRDRGEARDLTAARRTSGEMPDRRVALVSVDQIESELGRQLPDLRIGCQDSSGTSSVERSFVSADLILVFTVPSGTPSSSPISFAV